MDPATLALIASALGPALVTVFNKLAEKGVVEPALEKGLEPLRDLLTRGYDKKKDEAKLLKAMQAALPPVADRADPASQRWLNALAVLGNNPGLAARAAAVPRSLSADGCAGATAC